jgi:hypothetical protein
MFLTVPESVPLVTCAWACVLLRIQSTDMTNARKPAVAPPGNILKLMVASEGTELLKGPQ